MVVAALYGLAAVAYLAVFLSREGSRGLVASALLYTGLAIHAAWFVSERVGLGYFPIARPYEALSFVAWAIAASYVTIELGLRRRSFGAFIVPVVFVFQAVAAGFLVKAPPPRELSPILRSAWFQVHAGSALFSYCAFAIAFAAGLMHVLLCHELRLKRFGFFFARMPPLEVLERINRQAVALGFLFLTVGIASGVIWTIRARPQVGFLDAKEISALVVWLLYAANIHARVRMGWRGQRAALFSVVNFVLLFGVFCLTSLALKAHRF